MMPDGEAGGDMYQQRERLEQMFRQSKSLQRPAPGGLRLVCLPNNSIEHSATKSCSWSKHNATLSQQLWAQCCVCHVFQQL